MCAHAARGTRGPSSQRNALLERRRARASAWSLYIFLFFLPPFFRACACFAFRFYSLSALAPHLFLCMGSVEVEETRGAKVRVSDNDITDAVMRGPDLPTSCFARQTDAKRVAYVVLSVSSVGFCVTRWSSWGKGSTPRRN